MLKSPESQFFEQLTQELRFGDYVLDLDKHALFRTGQRVPLGNKSYEVLRFLVLHSGAIVTKKQLLDEVWEGRVSENNVERQISNLRRALGKTFDGGEYIDTVHGDGYRLSATVTACNPEAQRAIGEASKPSDLKARVWLERAIVVILLAFLVIAIFRQAYGSASVLFVIQAVFLCAGFDHLPESVGRRLLVALVFLGGMSYIPSAISESEAMENTVNAAALKPAILYLFIVGLRFVPMFVLVLGVWVLFGSGSQERHKSERLIFSLVGILLVSASAFATAAGYGEFEAWKILRPNGWLLFVADLGVVAGNLVLGFLTYKIVFKEYDWDGRLLAGLCFGIYLFVCCCALAVDHQLNVINHQYLDQRRDAYLVHNPDAIDQFRAQLDQGLDGEAGIDFVNFIRSAEFRQAMGQQKFYRAYHDEAFQMGHPAVTYGFRISGTKHYKMIRFPALIAHALLFERCEVK